MNVTLNQAKSIRAWVASGSMKEAAAQLGVSVKTVEFHLYKARQRLGIVPLYWLALWAVRNRIAEYPVKKEIDRIV